MANERGSCLWRPPRRPEGVALPEMLAACVLLGVLAGVMIPRFSSAPATARRNSCYVHKGNIEVQCQLWRRDRGTWPASDLSDIGADVSYFPEGLPVCPADGTAYGLDAAHRVVGHVH